MMSRISKTYLQELRLALHLLRRSVGPGNLHLLSGSCPAPTRRRTRGRRGTPPPRSSASRRTPSPAASRQRSTSSACMCSRVVGSSAPNGSSMRMMRGDRISVRAIATRCRMPPDSSLGYFVASRLTSRPTFAIHSRACSRRSAAGNAAAFEPERHVVLDRAIVERRVVLEDHAAIGARALHGLPADQHRPFGRRMVRPQVRQSDGARSICRSPTARGSR